MSVDIKTAVKTAVEHVRALMGNVHGLRLEEVEEHKTRAGWLVTVSFLQGEEEDSPIASLLTAKREYKQVEINGLASPLQ